MLPIPKRLRDLSLRRKILLANFLMVLVPVLLIVVLGTLLFAGLRSSGTLRQAELALLWPERGAAMSVSYAVSDLRWQAERGGKRAERFAEACRLLEQSGVQVVIARRTDADAEATGAAAQGTHGEHSAHRGAPADPRQAEAPPLPPQASAAPTDLLYASPGADAAAVIAAAQQSLGAPDAEGTRWQQGTFAFVHRARTCAVYAYGHLPLPAPGEEAAQADYLRHAALGLALFALFLALVFIVWLGITLARLLSRQVLGPLQELREAAAAIGRGELGGRIAIHAQDEVGETCACFDRMREDLLAAREEKERYEQGRRELLVGISHDLATPLTAIDGYATGLADGIARTPERRRHYAERITALTAQLAHLVDRLSLLSRLDHGRVAFHCAPVAIDAYLRAWGEATRAAWAETGDTLIYAPAPGAVDLAVSLDRAEFARVLENLAGNSRKYGADAAGHVRAELSLARQGEAVRITWRDHGPGVAADALPRLFESFYRADKSRGRKPGHGLGLAIAHRIVTGMGGTIRAAQAAGGGLAILMEFPAAPLAAEDAEIHTQERTDEHEEHLDHRGQ